MNIPVPFLKTSVGLGDAVKSATSAVGIKPCGGCQKRAAALNQHVAFVPRASTPTVESPRLLIDSALASQRRRLVMMQQVGEHRVVMAKNEANEYFVGSWDGTAMTDEKRAATRKAADEDFNQRTRIWQRP